MRRFWSIGVSSWHTTGQYLHVKFCVTLTNKYDHSNPDICGSRYFSVDFNKGDFSRQKGTYVCSESIFCSQQDQNKHGWLVEHRAVSMTSRCSEFVVKPVRLEVRDITRENKWCRKVHLLQHGVIFNLLRKLSWNLAFQKECPWNVCFIMFREGFLDN